jgi:hypothetical protein
MTVDQEERLVAALERIADSLDGGAEESEKRLHVAHSLDAVAYVAVDFEEALGLLGKMATSLAMRFAPDEFQRGIDLGLAEFIKKRSGGVQ